LQTQSSRKQTHFMRSSYPLSAPFGLLILPILYFELMMTPWSLQRIYTAGLWHTASHKVGDHIYNPAISWWGNCRNMCLWNREYKRTRLTCGV